jgi:hypothetical protein
MAGDLNYPAEPQNTQPPTALLVAQPTELEVAAQSEPDEDSRFLQLSRASDPERNARTRLPSGETVRLNSIRITEIFFPSHVQHLMDGLRTLGWLDTNRYGERESLADWISSTRSPLAGRAWARIGAVYPPGGAPPSWRVTGRLAERVLPEGVESVEFELVQITPSVTAIVAEFAFNEGAADSLNAALSADYATELEPNRLGHAVLTPEWLREKETTRRRKELRDGCAALVRELFPGIFAEEGEPEAYSSVDFLSVAKTDVVPLALSKQNSFLSALAVDGYIDTFSDEARSVLLVWDRAMRPSCRAVAIMITHPAGTRPYVPEGVISTEILFAALALRDALIDVIHEIGDLRDALTLGRDQDFLPSPETIRRVEMVLVSLSADLRPVVSELEQAEAIDWIKADLPSFAGLDQKFNNTQLPETLLTEIQFCAKNLSRAQQDLSVSVQTISSLASARASVELTSSNRLMQRTAIVISVASLVVAVISLIIRLVNTE